LASGVAPGVIVGLAFFSASVLLLLRYHIRAWIKAEQIVTTRFPQASGKTL